MNLPQPPEGILDPQQPWWPLGQIGPAVWYKLKGQLTGRRIPELSNQQFTSYVRLSDADADKLIENIKKSGHYPKLNQTGKTGGAYNEEPYQKWLVKEYLNKTTESVPEPSETESEIPLGLDDLIESIKKEDSKPKSRAIVASKFFGEERYERYVAELTAQGTIDGRPLSASERKEAFKKRRSKIDFKNFVDNLLEKKAAAGGGTGGPSVPTKGLLPGTATSAIVKYQPPISADDLKPEDIEKKVEKQVVTKDEVEEGLDSILDKIDGLLKEVRDTGKYEKAVADKDRKEKEKTKREEKENRLEGLRNFLAGPAQKIIAPIQNVFQQIMDAIGKILFAKVGMKLIDWYSEPGNAEKLNRVIKFFRRHWLLIVGGLLLFGTRLNGIVMFLMKIAFKFVPKMIKMTFDLIKAAGKLALKLGAKGLKFLRKPGAGIKGAATGLRAAAATPAAKIIGVGAGVAGAAILANEVTGQRKASGTQADNKAKAQTGKSVGLQGVGGPGDMGPTTPYGLLQGISGGGLVTPIEPLVAMSNGGLVTNTNNSYANSSVAMQGGGLVTNTNNSYANSSVAMQGGGFLNTLGRFLPGTGTVMAPKTVGNQTVAGYQNKFLGIPVGKPTFPRDSSGYGTGYSQPQMRKYEGANRNKQFVNTGGTLPQLVTRTSGTGNQRLDAAIQNAREVTQLPGGSSYSPLVESAAGVATKQQQYYDNLRAAMQDAGMSGANESMNLRGESIQYSGGGKVRGGYGGGDRIRAMLEPGEFVMSKGAVKKYGSDTLAKMNAAGGGNNKPKIIRDTVYAQGGGQMGGGKIKYFSTNDGRTNKPLYSGTTYKFSDTLWHHGASPGVGKNAKRTDGWPRDYTILHGTNLSSSPNADIPVPLDSEVIFKGPAGGYGNTVIVKNTTGRMLFAHLSKYGNISQGQQIKAGTIIGTQGKTGTAVDHLHLDAEPAGHEAFINFITSGKPTFGTTSDSVSGQSQSTDTNNEGMSTNIEQEQQINPIQYMQETMKLYQEVFGATPSDIQKVTPTLGVPTGQPGAPGPNPGVSNDIPRIGSIDPNNKSMIGMKAMHNIVG